MRPELSILSFLCLVLLIALTLLHVNSRNVAVLSLIGWLLVCSLIQGVDSIVWSGNAVVRSPIWCDIATKIVLGSRTAIPAACYCISFHLHFLSSNRDAKRRPLRLLFELTFCLIVPFIYMALHTIVQTHRFDLVQDIGCVASIFNSTPAVVLVWIPPFFFSILSLVFAGLALWSHVRRQQQLSDRACFSSRLITVTFLRPLFTAIAISLLVFILSIFDLCSALATDDLQPWTSLAEVHSVMSQVHIVLQTAGSKLERVEAWWWATPISTLIFSVLALIGLVYCAMHDSAHGHHEPGRWFRSSLFRRSRAEDEFIQCSEGFSTRFSTRFTIPSPTPLTPVHLVSGWDDSLRPSKARPKPAPIVFPLPPTSPSPSSASSDSGSSRSARTPTLAYLQSPTSPETPALATPAPAAAPPRWSALLKSPPPRLAAPLAGSPAESLLSSPWPRPPSTVPLSPVRTPPPSHAAQARLSPVSPVSSVARAPSRRYYRPPSTSSLTGSVASSTISTNAYLSDPDVLMHAVGGAGHRVPFQDAGIPTDVVLPSAGGAERSRSPIRMPSLEGLGGRKVSVGSRGGAGAKRREGRSEGIYMTVVKETQDV